jgi:hypothetical protein
MNRRLDSDFLTVQRLIAEGRLGPSYAIIPPIEYLNLLTLDIQNSLGGS